MKPVYVRMTDRFMSGWGQAKGMSNVLVVKCEGWEQAEAIRKAAEDRSEMKRVEVCINRPKNRPGILYSWKDFSDMGGPWLKYYCPHN